MWQRRRYDKNILVFFRFFHSAYKYSPNIKLNLYRHSDSIPSVNQLRMHTSNASVYWVQKIIFGVHLAMLQKVENVIFAAEILGLLISA